jgi:hypothetical protein
MCVIFGVILGVILVFDFLVLRFDFGLDLRAVLMRV